MSKENVKLFNEALTKDTTLQEKLKLIGEKYNEKKPDESQLDSIYQNEIIPAAKEAGFDFTLEEMKEYEEAIKNPKLGELTEDELDSVAGGAVCACVLGGGGGSNNGSCMCIFHGEGGSNWSDNKGACFCIIGGGGDL